MAFNIEPVAIERDNIDIQIKALTKRRDELDKQITEALPKDDEYALDGVVVAIRTTMTLDKNALAEAYPAATYPQLYSPALDTEKVNDNFAPTMLAQFKKAGKRSVSVKVLEDA